MWGGPEGGGGRCGGGLHVAAVLTVSGVDRTPHHVDRQWC